MFVVNKNISHNGKFYAKGSEIKESDPGFKDMKSAGHIDGEASAPVEIKEEKQEMPAPVIDAPKAVLKKKKV